MAFALRRTTYSWNEPVETTSRSLFLLSLLCQTTEWTLYSFSPDHLHLQYQYAARRVATIKGPMTVIKIICQVGRERGYFSLICWIYNLLVNHTLPLYN